MSSRSRRQFQRRVMRCHRVNRFAVIDDPLRVQPGVESGAGLTFELSMQIGDVVVTRRLIPSIIVSPGTP